MNWHTGTHDIKFGGEFLKDRDTKVWSLNRRGTYVFNTPAVRRRFSSAAFPADAWDDPARWDISGLRAVSCSGSTSTSTPTTWSTSRGPTVGGVVRRQLAGDRTT